ncbi:hypothetical protein JAAARDRAFT_194862 [Jaapia argillacea MUCL 33604]|uniref:Uncharacterized protein n=1 Tax=Jaapia argillacea MUCL 33604 TaxID=933084 RepID=A0A067PSX1_9AGAM|nr:hypothetical protein JAAARDRAFT_194862 [Jaapia argillacea MUCL 33604]
MVDKWWGQLCTGWWLLANNEFLWSFLADCELIRILLFTAPLSLSSSAVNPAQPFTIPEINASKSEVGQQSQPTFLWRTIAKLPVIAPPLPPLTNQDVDPPARMDVNNTGDNVSSEEIPTGAAPITFARRKVNNPPCLRTPAPNNAVPSTTVVAMEVDNGPIGSEAPPKIGKPKLPRSTGLPIDRYKLLLPSVSPINRPHRELSPASPQPVVPDWLGTASLRAIAVYYDQANPSPASVQNPTFCQIDACGSLPPAPVDLDEMISRFTTLPLLPDSHIPKSVQTIPHVSIPASEDKGTPTRQSEGITATPIDKITQTPLMVDRPSYLSADASNIAGPSMPAGNVPNQESVWQLPPQPGWKFPGDYPSRSRLHLLDAHKRVILKATQDMHLLSRIARSLEEHMSKINILRELIQELEDGQ